MTFKYEAHDRFASTSIGEIEADSDVQAGEFLRDKGLFVTQIVAMTDGAELKPILKHENILGANGINSTEDTDDLEKELFGEQKQDDFGILPDVRNIAPGKKTESFNTISPVVPDVPEIRNWQDDLAKNIDRLGDALKTIHQWRIDYNAHQIDNSKVSAPTRIGGKSWEVIEKALPEAEKQIVTEILRRAVFGQSN